MRLLDLSRAWWGAAVVVGLWAVVGTAAATSFDVPPTIGDRRIALTWPADSDDPIFNGNTVLRIDGRIDSAYATGQSIPLLVSNGTSTEFFAYAAGDDRIQRRRTEDGAWLEDLHLPAGATPRALAVHGSDARVIAAMEDGSLVVWTLDGNGQGTVAAQGVVSRSVLFPSSIRDPDDLRYVSADVDDSVRVWSAPGRLLGRGYTLAIPSGVAGGLLLSADRTYLGVGTSSGEVRMYDLRTPPNTPMLRLQGHAAPIVDLAFARDASKLASIDRTGQLRVWRFPDGQLLSNTETGFAATESTGPRISLSPPRGRLLSLVGVDGTVQILNGLTGQVYATMQVTADQRPMTAVAFAADGVHTYVGDADGTIALVRAGDCLAGPETPRCFGGYMIWRSPTTNPKDAVLLRVYNFADSTWTFSGKERAFIDPDSIPRRLNPPTGSNDDGEVESDLRIAGPHDGIPYFYSVTRFDLVYQKGGTFPVFNDGADAIVRGFYRDHPSDPPTALVAEAPARTEEPMLGDVIVVPNPYEAGSVPWELAGVPHVEFRNLPERASIQIYSLAGDLVREIEHGPGKYGQSSNTAEWDLRNSSGRAVASGVYIYQVKTAAGGGKPGEVTTGYFTVVF